MRYDWDLSTRLQGGSWLKKANANPQMVSVDNFPFDVEIRNADVN